MINFHIQLLSDKSVVLVEAEGHESEIFLPQLYQDRIALRNVICSRRPNSHVEDVESCSSNSNSQVQSTSPQANQKYRLGMTTAALGPSMGETSIPNGRTGFLPPESVRNLQFSLKLISNGSVVLVECKGHESEIFLPLLCSRYIAMKRVTATELVQCSRLGNRAAPPQNPNPSPTVNNLNHCQVHNQKQIRPPKKVQVYPHQCSSEKSDLLYSPMHFFANAIAPADGRQNSAPNAQSRARRKRRQMAKLAGAGDQHLARKR
ncbi:hypothetical protein KR018_011220 [Drosophila ironensis]|nr:hypothetical protein KR018_011220 [Drosophila ironensis]